ncbi:endonuclease related [Holotrichia oblita]|uniref:Endonuclease related n=2 Tax=Holotrichia oblita TaxID=644536 RepID=A0ACB9SNU4_HOLOL|nr:endonuclease related [Holotrichia oblita]KAI4457003.1 endonuclease related [Holotrichia oblita]
MLTRLPQAYLFLNVITFFTIEIKAIYNSECSISINQDLTDARHPLLIQTTLGKPEFVLPTVDDKIILKQNDEIELFCPNSFNASSKDNLRKVICDKGKFILNGSIVRFSTLTCPKPLKDVARYTGKKCLRDYEEFEIGYEYKNDFLTLITGCFDKTKQNTLYTISTISRMINGKKYTHPRKSFWTQGSFYRGVSVDNVYKRNNQRIAINSQLGLDRDSRIYITEDDQKYYLARGHLAPKADFIYGPQQDITFYFLNAVPQWNLLNTGNWKILEDDLRRFASIRGIDLKIVTGTSEIFSLPYNFTQQSVELFLNTQTSTKTIPIPKFIWKVAYHEVSSKGVAFVGVNNPFLKEDFNEYTICRNICRKLNYIHINLNYVKNGYVYCCEVGDLIKTVSTIPITSVSGLLT